MIVNHTSSSSILVAIAATAAALHSTFSVGCTAALHQFTSGAGTLFCLTAITINSCSVKLAGWLPPPLLPLLTRSPVVNLESDDSLAEWYSPPAAVAVGAVLSCQHLSTGCQRPTSASSISVSDDDESCRAWTRAQILDGVQVAVHCASWPVCATVLSTSTILFLFPQPFLLNPTLQPEWRAQSHAQSQHSISLSLAAPLFCFAPWRPRYCQSTGLVVVVRMVTGLVMTAHWLWWWQRRGEETVAVIEVTRSNRRHWWLQAGRRHWAADNACNKSLHIRQTLLLLLLFTPLLHRHTFAHEHNQAHVYRQFTFFPLIHFHQIAQTLIFGSNCPCYSSTWCTDAAAGADGDSCRRLKDLRFSYFLCFIHQYIFRKDTTKAANFHGLQLLHRLVKIKPFPFLLYQLLSSDRLVRTVAMSIFLYSFLSAG